MVFPAVLQPKKQGICLQIQLCLDVSLDVSALLSGVANAQKKVYVSGRFLWDISSTSLNVSGFLPIRPIKQNVIVVLFFGVSINQILSI